MEHWYAIYTRPREEAVAEVNLVRQGFETYWPRYRRRINHARKTQDVTTSLFPRYLFTRFDPGSTGWKAIRSTRGVAGLVSQGVDPVPVPRSLLDDIRARQDGEGYVVLGRQIELHQGQRVRLTTDAFRGHDIIFDTKKDNERVVVLLGLLGREFRVTVPVSQVVPLT